MPTGEDLHYVWHHPESDIELKKRIVRTLIREIVLRIDGAVVNAVVHWEGGDHTRLLIPRNRRGAHRWKTSEEAERIIREVVRGWSDRRVAALLNRLGKRTAKGHSWTPARGPGVGQLEQWRSPADRGPVAQPRARADRHPGQLRAQPAPPVVGRKLQLHARVPRRVRLGCATTTP